MARPKRSSQPSPRNIWVTKLSFRIASLIFSVILGALNGYLGANWGTLGVVMLSPPAIVSILWGSLDIFLLLTNTTHRGIHYIKVLVVDLILGFGYIGAVTLYGIWENNSRDDRNIDNNARTIIDNTRNAVSAMAAFQILCHFSVFSIACYETHHRKRLFPDATLSAYKLDDTQVPPAYGELYPEYGNYLPMNQPETSGSKRREELDRKT